MNKEKAFECICEEENVMEYDVLYSVLKMTREGKDTKPIEDGFYEEAIIKRITIKDIIEMNADDVKDAVICYIRAIVPGIKEK